MSSAQKVIEEISEFDSIYRSDCEEYVRFRKNLLLRAERTLNVRFRRNNYLSLRILLLETTRSKVKHSLQDLWLLLYSRWIKSPAVIPISPSENELAQWIPLSKPFSAPSPVSQLRFAPLSDSVFAFSTLDGALFLGDVKREISMENEIELPGVSFLKFQWISQNAIVGFGIESSSHIISGSSLFEFSLPSPPSELCKYQNSSVFLFGDRSGNVYCVDLIESQKDDPMDWKLLSKTITSLDLQVTKLHNSKKSITALSNGMETGCVICGNSIGEVDVLQVELKSRTFKKRQISYLKLKTAMRISMSNVVRNLKNSSIDALSIIKIHNFDLILVNCRSEHAVLFISKDGMKSLQTMRTFRVPSNRARCPAALTKVKDKWIVVAGTDMGDLVLAEEGEDTLILTLHDVSIGSLDWAEDAHVFLASDTTGLISCWIKNH